MLTSPLLKNWKIVVTWFFLHEYFSNIPWNLYLKGVKSNNFQYLDVFTNMPIRGFIYFLYDTTAHAQKIYLQINVKLNS